jgi:hypothetical protein
MQNLTKKQKLFPSTKNHPHLRGKLRGKLRAKARFSDI